MCIADDEGTVSAWSVPHHGGHIPPPMHNECMVSSSPWRAYIPPHAKNLIRSASHIPLGTVPREAEHTDLLDEL